MARAIAYALAEDGLAHVVKQYFDANPSLPPNSLLVKTLEIFEGKALSFRDLLKEILKTKATSELLIVTHGYLNGVGIVLPLAPGALDTKSRHLEALMKISDSGTGPTDRQLQEMGIGTDAAAELIALMKKVQAMNFSLIEWRACDLGKIPATLEVFRKFFGAKRMGAPKMENIFGASPVEIMPLDKIPDMKGFVAYSYPDKFKPKVVNYLKLDPGSGWPQEGKIYAASDADLTAWVKKYINPDAKPNGKIIQVHALWKDPDSDHPLDNPSPILPLEPDYARNITYTP